MDVNQGFLREAAARGLLQHEQVLPLWQFLASRPQETPSLRLTHLLYYLGGLLAIGAMSLFMTLGWETFGGWGIFSISLAYMLGGLLLTEYFLQRLQLPVPAGVTACFVLVLVPLAVYGLQLGMGWWLPDYAYQDYHHRVSWQWLLMEMATLVAAILLLWRYRLPFLVMPMAVTLWYMSMDLLPFLLDGSRPDWTQRKQFSLIFGLLVTGVALVVDLRNRSERDYAFWLYFSGVASFWCALTLLDSGSEWGRFFYACINLLMLLAGTLLQRRVFVVFGALGILAYLSYLSYDLFRDSWLFPFVLTLLGFALIFLGVLWQRHESRLAGYLSGLLPQSWQTFLQQRH